MFKAFVCIIQHPVSDTFAVFKTGLAANFTRNYVVLIHLKQYVGLNMYICVFGAFKTQKQKNNMHLV